MKSRLLVLLAFSLGSTSLVVTDASAQFVSDAVRVMRDPLPVGARTTGMNRSIIAGVRDYSALALNPAGLAPIDFREFGITLAHRANSSTAQFLGQTSEATIGSTDLGSLGFAFKVPTEQGHLAFGVSYDRLADFTNRYSFKAVNENSSFLNTRGFIDDPGIASGETIAEYREYLSDNNLAWSNYLTEDIDSTNTKLRTRLTGGLEQSGTVTEEGGMNALRFGGGVDIAEGVAVGASANIIFGHYENRRVLNEIDVNDRFNEAGDAPNGFISAEIIDTRTQSQAGLNLKLGLLVYSLDLVQFGLTVETPTWLRVEDSFLRTGSSVFASGERFESEARHEPVTVNEYDIVTPFKFGAGFTFQLPNTTISAGAQYYDASSVSFSNSEFLGSVNDDAIDLLQPVLSWSVGAEHVIPLIGVAVRAGYGIEGSPYKIDTDAAYDIKTLSAGLSVLLSKSTALEVSYRRLSNTTDHTLYNDVTPDGQAVSAFIDRDEISRNEISLSFGYRF